MIGRKLFAFFVLVVVVLSIHRIAANHVVPPAVDCLRGTVQKVNFIKSDKLTATFVTFGLDGGSKEFPTRMLCGDERRRFREGRRVHVDLASATCGWQILKQY
ncbi:MAG TPA: hypothetical protein VNG29_03615 [Candidatus Paceibacterota bacterium]|nr:hypothetical protein [Candidatus Paceibacterota bacterium]